MYCSVICYQRFVTDLPVCLWIMDPHRKAPKKNASHGDEVLPQDTTHLIQRPCYQRGSLCKDAAGNQTPLRPPDHPQKRRKLQWHGSVSRSSGLAKTILQGTVNGEKKDKADRGRGGSTSGNGQAWSSPSPRRQWRIEKNGGSWLQNHLWCPNNPHGQGIVDDDDDTFRRTSAI